MLLRWNLTPGLTPRCSQGGWGWPQLQRGIWEAKSGKRDNCLFCRTTPLHAQFPALPRLPCHFPSTAREKKLQETQFLQRITSPPFIFGAQHFIHFLKIHTLIYRYYSWPALTVLVIPLLTCGPQRQKNTWGLFRNCANPAKVTWLTTRLFNWGKSRRKLVWCSNKG